MVEKDRDVLKRLFGPPPPGIFGPRPAEPFVEEQEKPPVEEEKPRKSFRIFYGELSMIAEAESREELLEKAKAAGLNEEILTIEEG